MGNKKQEESNNWPRSDTNAPVQPESFIHDMRRATKIPEDVLLIFVGHSNDAKDAARHIRTIQLALQEELIRFETAASAARLSFRRVQVFEWELDAPAFVDGQGQIDRKIDQAHVGIFVFQDRVGSVTREELERCRVRGIPVIAVFAKNPSFTIASGGDLEVYSLAIDDWRKRQEFKTTLPQDWSDEHTTAIRPQDEFESMEELYNIVLYQLKLLLPHLCRREPVVSQRPSDDSQLQFIARRTTRQGFDAALVKRYREQLSTAARHKFPDDLSDEMFLRRAGYFRDGMLTYSGVLLFDHCPAPHILPTAKIRLFIHGGVERLHPDTRSEAVGTIVEQVETAFEFIKEVTGREKLTDSLRPASASPYPLVCVREILANAVCHRDYSDTERCCFVEIFADRIEIRSPGAWMGGVSIPDKKPLLLSKVICDASIQNNFVLADALYDIQLVEAAGTGLRKAVKDCADKNAPEPSVAVIAGYVVTTIFPCSRNEDRESHLEYAETNSEILAASDLLHKLSFKQIERYGAESQEKKEQIQGDLGTAIRVGREEVERIVKSLVEKSLDGLSLDDVETVIAKAIEHGAGVYNHSARGRIGCGEIYFSAAGRLEKLDIHDSSVQNTIPTDASLALSWLRAIVNAVGEITTENGDDAAWELRFCFDSIPLIPRCDEITLLLLDVARRGKVSLIPRVVLQVAEQARNFPEHVAAYELRHMVRNLLWLHDQQPLQDRNFGRAIAPLRKLNDASSRITLRNAKSLRQDLTNGLIRFSQDMDSRSDEGIRGRLFRWLKW